MVTGNLTEEDLNFLEKFNFNSPKTIFNKGLDVLKRINSGQLRPLLSSIGLENNLTGGYYPTDQLAIVGKSRSGKSTRLLSLIDDFINPVINPTYENKLIILYNSWEISAWRNSLKLLSKQASKSMEELLDYHVEMKKEQIVMLEQLAEKFYDKPLFINSNSTSARNWYDTNVNIAERFPNHTILIATDHTRLITMGNITSEEALITQMMHYSVKLKNEKETINIFLSQLNRNYETNSRTRGGVLGEALPTSDDIFGADSVNQTSDIIMALHRPGLYNLYDFPFQGKRIRTGLGSNGEEDDLLIENFIKHRHSKEGVIAIKQILKYGQYREFNTQEKLERTVGNKRGFLQE
jgi:replicative DNA helicase